MNAERYQRQIVLPDFGAEGQQKLLDAKVVVVGAGGLGVPVLQYLVGMGVGTILIVDGDDISLSNLQRQILYSTADVGKKKAEVAKERLRGLNPEVSIEVTTQMFDGNNAKDLISGCDLVIDCTDNIETRYIINDNCVTNEIPFVYGALYKHEGHVSVFNYQGSLSYRDVYPDDSAKVDNCNEIGVLGVLPGIIGTYQAMEAVKVLTGIGEPLAGKLLVVDAINTEHHVFELAPITKPEKKKNNHQESWLTWHELTEMDLERYHLIDVRSEVEYSQNHDDRFENRPINELTTFKADKEVILVCNKGNATRQAAALIAAQNQEIKVFQMKGGYSTQ
ncbi:molybdopterin-synthase adenylyltransferase MoeB [Ekhidna sp.]|uniref:molybdopterin-synthase adenylyltransferase MoeB n=1 Tax=Ekhidna sp. TaxID=2608089 RepID=UPI003B501DFA